MILHGSQGELDVRNSGETYKTFLLVNYASRVVVYALF